MAANIGISKRKRQHSKTLHVDDAEEGTGTPDSSEGSTIADQEFDLNELLEELNQPLTQGQSQPPTVSHWCEDYNDQLIRTYFKMRRTVVNPGDFIARYLFGGSVQVYEDMKTDRATEMGPLQDFLQQSTSYVNFTEPQLFLPSKYPKAKDQARHRQRIHDSLIREMENIEDITLLDGVHFSSINYKRVAMRLKTLMCQWVKKVAQTVNLSPHDVQESTYEEIFWKYLEMFNLECVNGRSVKLGIPYGSGTISRVPDILFRKDERGARFCGAVEVKKMTLDPTLRHAFDKPPEKGILSKPNDEPQSPKKMKVNFQPEEASGSSAKEESEEKEIDKPPSDEPPSDKPPSDKPPNDKPPSALGVGGAALTDPQREFIKLFFGQLFGSVLALDSCEPPAMGLPRQRLGIGVVGFRVVFIIFNSKPDVPFTMVPYVGSHRMDVVMTPALSLLNASDRKKMDEILLALSDNEPQPVKD